jgi:hypothetical protein
MRLKNTPEDEGERIRNAPVVRSNRIVGSIKNPYFTHKIGPPSKTGGGLFSFLAMQFGNMPTHNKNQAI